MQRFEVFLAQPLDGIRAPIVKVERVAQSQYAAVVLLPAKAPHVVDRVRCRTPTDSMNGTTLLFVKPSEEIGVVYSAPAWL